MNRTIEDKPVQRLLLRNTRQLRAHLRDFADAYNFATRLKTLKRMTPYEFVCKAWTSQPNQFKLNPLHKSPGPKRLVRARARRRASGRRAPFPPLGPAVRRRRMVRRRRWGRFRSVGSQHLALEQDPAVLNPSVAGDRRAAEPSNSARKARSAASPIRRGIGDGREHIARRSVRSPSGQRDRALTGGGGKPEVERSPRPVNETEPLEPRTASSVAPTAPLRPCATASRHFPEEAPASDRDAGEGADPAGERAAPKLAPAAGPRRSRARLSSARRAGPRAAGSPRSRRLRGSPMASPSPNERRRRSRPQEGPRRSPW